MNNSLVSAKIVTPQEAFTKYITRARKDLVLLDVRTQMEVIMDGFLEGAIHIPMHELQERLLNEVPKDTAVLVYCAHGVRSAAVVKAMVQAGYREVYDLQGGISDWIAAGLPIRRDMDLAETRQTSP